MISSHFWFAGWLEAFQRVVQFHGGSVLPIFEWGVGVIKRSVFIGFA